MKIGCIEVLATTDEWRSPAARVVAFGGFDFHHIGAEVSECLPDPGARQNAGELDYAQFAQRRCHERTLCSAAAAQRKSCWSRPPAQANIRPVGGSPSWGFGMEIAHPS